MTAHCRKNRTQKNTKRIPNKKVNKTRKENNKKKCPKAKEYSNDVNCYKEKNRKTTQVGKKTEKCRILLNYIFLRLIKFYRLFKARKYFSYCKCT